MKSLIAGVMISLVILGLSGCSSQPTPKELTTWKKECKKIQNDNEDSHFIFAQGECLEYYEAKGSKKDEITVLIHGSWPRGSDPLERRYAQIADDMSRETSITTLALAMPGYSYSTSNRYKDMSWRENKTVIPAEEEFVKIVASFIQKLKTKYHAKKVNIFGKSSGAMLGGIISGYQPGLIDKYILMGGAYDVYFTYRHNNWGTKNPGLLSSVDFVSDVKKDAQFLIIAGENDRKAPPLFATQYKKRLNNEEINAEVLVIQGAKHSSLETNYEVLESTYKFLNN